MNKLVFYSTLILIAGIAFANFSSAENPKPKGPGEEYLTIQYSGRHETHVLYADGKAQFFPELANISRIERVNERTLLIHTLINKFAKDGYEYVDTPEPNQVIMKKKSTF